ncbi:MAG: glycosyltransferase, partial [Proteobacteria bacterium]|nr:glycosyltransferase [Pseudomonadota bacterium]
MASLRHTPVALPRVTVIILNYNLTDYTIDCVRSLLAVEYPSIDILIVDNGSTDHPLPRLKSLFPRLEIHSTGENLGYTGGINA